MAAKSERYFLHTVATVFLADMLVTEVLVAEVFTQG